MAAEERPDAVRRPATRGGIAGPAPRPCTEGARRFACSREGGKADGRVPGGGGEGELPRARAAHPAVLARGGRLPRESSTSPGFPGVDLLRGPADGERAPRHPPHGVAHVQRYLPALQDDDRTLRPPKGRLGLPRPAG